MGIAVVILFYLYFTNKPVGVTKDETTIATDTEKDSVEAVTIDGNIYHLPSASIVYVNFDSLLDNYTYFEEKREQLRKRQEGMERDLNASVQALEKEVAKYQEQAGTMTPTLRQITEENLIKKEQSLMERRQDLISQLRDEEDKVQNEIYDDLNNYLKEFNKDKNYNFILSFSRSSDILFANDSLDITNAVLQGLNKRAKP